MLSYLFIGANDMAASGRFYQAVLGPLGYQHESDGRQLLFSLPDVADRDNGPGTVYIAPPFNGQPAASGNGFMPGFRAATRKLVEEIHAAGISAGGSDEGEPGTRERYNEHFYVAYLRDPAGNKLAVFCND